MGIGIARLVSWVWEWEREWLDGNGGNESPTFSHLPLTGS